jgi:sigma-B regulation protein RsbU (phosphoserine phosphatase)
VLLLVFYSFSRQQLEKMTYQNAHLLTENTAKQIEQTIVPITQLARNYVWLVEQKLSTPDSLWGITKNMLQNNPQIMGCAIALAPNYYSNRDQYFAPYAFRQADSIVSKQLGNQDYNYCSKEWYTVPTNSKQAHWSEPYFDAGGGNAMMTTYSVPIYATTNKGKTVVGVLSIDLALEQFATVVNTVKIMETGYATVISPKGVFISNPNKGLILHHSIFTYAQKIHQPELQALGEQILQQKNGIITTTLAGVEVKVYYRSLNSSNWILTVIFPTKEMYAPLRNTLFLLIILVALGLFLLTWMIHQLVSKQIAPLSLFASTAKEIANGNFQTILPEVKTVDEIKGLRDAFSYMQQNLVEYLENLKATTTAKEKIESEIRIAREIQMSMVPQVFPAFPNRKEFDLHASLTPAKLVGGDLYDYFMEENKLFFIIADVSGKGVPASLLMAVTRNLFRSVAMQSKNPATMVAMLNQFLVENNQSNMFVTLFLGVLDLNNGLLEYCNAGHNPPVVMHDTIESLAVYPNLPIGLVADFEFQLQSFQLLPNQTLLLYTDGLTEAENKEQILFGEQRLLQLLAVQKSVLPKQLIDNILREVQWHVQDAEQSDDLAILTLLYKGLEKIYSNRIALLNTVEQIPALQSFVEEVGYDLALGKFLTMQLNLALEEAVSNIIFYAYKNKHDQTIEIELTQFTDYLEITIKDQGQFFDPTKIATPNLNASLDQKPIGGLGFHLIRQIMHQVSYARVNESNVLTLQMNWNKPK